ncbi:MAG: PAS domain S-box protein [Deltaproteobacteria bacterium]|nr:PAS domain S-box protein [Candidatus Desulfobacula maris]
MTEKPTYEELEKKIQELEQAESARKRAEDELQMSEEKFRVLFKKSIHGILIVDIETRRLPYANPAFCRMFGYSETEMLQIGVEDIHPKGALDYILSVFSRQKQGKKAGATELPCIHKDGTIFNADIAATNIVINHRKCVVGFFIDITERKLAEEALVKHRNHLEELVKERTHELEEEISEHMRAEETLKESEEKYRTVLEANPDPVAVYDIEGNVIYFNPAFTRLFGWSLEECLNKKMDVFVPEDAWHETKKMIKKVLSGERFSSIKTWRYNKKGDIIPVSISGAIYKDQDGNPIGSVINLRDISDQKKMEAQLQQSQKMESIGTLAGGIAHDFNNILSPILGYVEMILMDTPKDSPVRESLNQIYTSALRAKNLVKQILTFSRQDSSELILMKMQPVIKEALNLIRSTIPTTIEIKQDINPNCGIIKADPTQIHQIVMNLTTNAYHAMEETGGELKVSLKEVELGEYDIMTPDMTPGVYACLIVADTGVGMDKNLTDKIFDPFFTTKAIGKGTGMGLSVTHGIVNKMEGTIQVHSEPGKGTQFHVYLPVEKNSPEEQARHSTAKIQGGTEHILLVDDEEAILTMEKQVLERLGYKVTYRTSSLEALEAFRANPNKFDLVITDMAMPNMPGDKLSVELTKIRSDIPILLCTGFSETMSEEKAESIGIKGFLMKPIVMKDLAQKIREVLDECKI